MGLLCLSTRRDEPLVLYTSDGPVIFHASRGRGRVRHVAWRIFAPPAVRVWRGDVVPEAEFVDACASVAALQELEARRAKEAS